MTNNMSKIVCTSLVKDPKYFGSILIAELAFHLRKLLHIRLKALLSSSVAHSQHCQSVSGRFETASKFISQVLFGVNAFHVEFQPQTALGVDA